MKYDPYGRALQPRSAAPIVLLVLGLLGSGAGNYWLWQERQKLTTQVRDATGKLAALDATQKELTEKVETLGTENDTLTAAKEKLTKDAEPRARDRARLDDISEKLAEKLKEEIAAGDVALSKGPAGIRVEIAGKSLFESNDALLSKQGEGVLLHVGMALTSVGDRQIQVLGHTDPSRIPEKLTTRWPTNWELSAALAGSVVRYLQTKGGVPAQRLVASGQGEHHPIANNKNAVGRARNRRVEILIAPLPEVTKSDPQGQVKKEPDAKAPGSEGGHKDNEAKDQAKPEGPAEAKTETAGEKPKETRTDKPAAEPGEAKREKPGAAKGKKPLEPKGKKAIQPSAKGSSEREL